MNRYFLIPLVIGWCLGAATVLVVGRTLHMPRMREHHMQRMRERFFHKLDLSRDQRDHVMAILSRTHQKLDDLYAQTRAQEAEIRQATRQEIRALLTPDQQKTQDVLDAKMDARIKKRYAQNPHPWH